MNKELNVSESGDYCAIQAGPYSAYFGYEYAYETGNKDDEDSNTYGLIVKKDGIVVASVPEDDLPIGPRNRSMAGKLLVGLAWMFQTGKLIVPDEDDPESDPAYAYQEKHRGDEE